MAQGSSDMETADQEESSPNMIVYRKVRCSELFVMSLPTSSDLEPLSPSRALDLFRKVPKINFSDLEYEILGSLLFCVRLKPRHFKILRGMLQLTVEKG